jgi:2-oxoglutarate ferredoxin oxidoreductase subunit alpha
MSKVLMKGNEAIAEASIRAGLHGYFGYPITPQNEFTAYMSVHMLKRGRAFVQAESEVAAINMVYGGASTGCRVMTSSSSPGVALMQEGISYMYGAQVPAVIVNISRGGPGLGNIGPSQGDYNQATRGGGNGDCKLIVYAPATVQEAVDLTYQAFDVAEKYRTPVCILGDGALGQMAEPVELPEEKEPSSSDLGWGLGGAKGRPTRQVMSLRLAEGELKKHNWDLHAKFQEISENEVKYEVIDGGCDVLIVAFGTAARVAKTSVRRLRAQGIKAGLFRPVTISPYPYDQLHEAARNVKTVLVAEMNTGQMLFDVKVALNGTKPVEFIGSPGGEAFSPEDIELAVKNITEAGK